MIHTYEKKSLVAPKTRPKHINSGTFHMSAVLLPGTVWPPRASRVFTLSGRCLLLLINPLGGGHNDSLLHYYIMWHWIILQSYKAGSRA